MSQENMNSTLSRLGMIMRETHVFAHHGTDVPFAILFSGLARSCHSRVWVATLMQPVTDGDASATFLLNYNNRTTKGARDAYDEHVCEGNLRAYPRVAYSTISFQHARTGVCSETLLDRWAPHRIEMMWFTVARTYILSRRHFGGVKWYVRARMDDAKWCIPRDLPPSTTRWVAVNMYACKSPRKGPMCASDRQAIVPTRVADSIFAMWRVWRDPLDCDAACLGKGLPHRDAQKCYGEVVWNAWLSANAPLKVYSIPASNGGIFRQMDANHVRIGFERADERSQIAWTTYTTLSNRTRRRNPWCRVHLRSTY